MPNISWSTRSRTALFGGHKAGEMTALSLAFIDHLARPVREGAVLKDEELARDLTYGRQPLL